MKKVNFVVMILSVGRINVAEPGMQDQQDPLDIVSVKGGCGSVRMIQTAKSDQMYLDVERMCNAFFLKNLIQ